MEKNKTTILNEGEVKTYGETRGETKTPQQEAGTSENVLIGRPFVPAPTVDD